MDRRTDRQMDRTKTICLPTKVGGDLITTIKKVETDIITSNTDSQIGRARILVIMFVETFRTYMTVFIGNVIMLIFTICQFVDTNNITWWYQRKNVQITNNWKYNKNILTSIIPKTLSSIVSIPTGVDFRLGPHLMLCPNDPHFITWYIPGPIIQCQGCF